MITTGESAPGPLHDPLAGGAHDIACDPEPRPTQTLRIHKGLVQHRQSQIWGKIFHREKLRPGGDACAVIRERHRLFLPWC